MSQRIDPINLPQNSYASDATHSTAPAADAAAAPTVHLLAKASKPVSITLVSMAVCWGVWSFLGGTPPRLQWAQHVLLPLCTLLLVLALSARHEVRWVLPMRRLCKLLESI